MRYRLLASYQDAPYEAGVGPEHTDVVLFAACPPPEELRFEPATGHWRKHVSRSSVQAIYESRPVGVFRGEPCVVLDDLTDRLHIAYLGHDAYRAEQLGYWEVDRGVFELITPRHEVTDIVEQRLPLDHPADDGPPGTGRPAPAGEARRAGGYPADVTLPAVDEPPLPLEAEALRAATATAYPAEPAGPGPSGPVATEMTSQAAAGISEPVVGLAAAIQPVVPSWTPQQHVAHPAEPARPVEPARAAGSSTAATPGLSVQVHMQDGGHADGGPSLGGHADGGPSLGGPARSDAPAGQPSTVSSGQPVQPVQPVQLAQAGRAVATAPRTGQARPSAAAFVPAEAAAGVMVQRGPALATAPLAAGPPTAGPIARPAPAPAPAPAVPAPAPAPAVPAPAPATAADRPSATRDVVPAQPLVSGQAPLLTRRTATPAVKVAPAPKVTPAPKVAPDEATAQAEPIRAADPDAGRPDLVPAPTVPVAAAGGIAEGLQPVLGQAPQAPAADPAAMVFVAQAPPVPQAPVVVPVPEAPVTGPTQEAPIVVSAPVARQQAQVADAHQHGAEAGPGPAGTAGQETARPRSRRSSRRRMPTQQIFSDLAAQAAIPPTAYSIGEEVDGAMCLIETDGGYEVFTSVAGARHEVRGFADEESAYFYLFGVLVADSVRTGALAPQAVVARPA